MKHNRTHAYNLRLGLELSLIICASFVLVSRPYLIDAVRKEEITSLWLLCGPGVFIFIVVAIFILDIATRECLPLSSSQYLRFGFAVIIGALLFPASFREYRSRQLPDPENIALIEKFSSHKDAGIRALAVLASYRHKITNPRLGALIHKALLDKDPLVQQAAKLVIEDNFGISLKNGAEGIHQAQSFLTDVASSALLMRKGSP